MDYSPKTPKGRTILATGSVNAARLSLPIIPLWQSVDYFQLEVLFERIEIAIVVEEWKAALYAKSRDPTVHSLAHGETKIERPSGPTELLQFNPVAGSR